MKNIHLSTWEHEECVLGQRTPEMLRHLSECASCRLAVERLEQGIALFRDAAMEWSSECLASRPQQPHIVTKRRLLPPIALRWAIAAVIPMVLLALALFPFHVWSPQPVHRAPEISDDVLLQQVDDQVSTAVPASMESLTHLVSTDGSNGRAVPASVPSGGKHLVQTN
jgi:hypothetical protein